jgi:hypothetical protein
MSGISGKDLAYRTLAAALGGPVDLTSMVMRPFGYKVGKPILGSEWIGEKMEQKGLVSSVRDPLKEFAASIMTPSPGGLAAGLSKASVVIPALAGMTKLGKVEDALGAGQVVKAFRGRVAEGPLNMRGGVAYFTPDRSAAKSYVDARLEEGWDGPGNIMEANLTLKNPASESDIRRLAEENGIDLLHPDYPVAYLDGSPELVKVLKDAGYDGARGLDGRPDTGKEIESLVVFSRDQVNPTKP